MIRIIPSIASANLLCIGEELKKAKAFGALHLDIEDGNFSPDITFGMDMVSQIAAVTDLELDAHLMVTDPVRFVDPLLENGVRNIAVHIEADEYPSRSIEKIRQGGGKAGLALNYKTRVDAVEPYLDRIDYVLLQTGEAGDPNLAFRPFTMEKIRRLAVCLYGSSVRIWVDGGVKKEMLSLLQQEGVSCVVMGRAVFAKGGGNTDERLSDRYL